MICSRLAVVAAALAASIACSSDMAESDADTDSRFLDTGEIDSDDADTDPEEVPADFWSVDGHIVLVAGEIDVVQSTLTLTSWNEGVISCERVVPVEAAISSDAPVDSGALAWWSLRVGDGEVPDPPCDFSRPSEIELGFAAPDSRLQPAMDQRGLGDASAYSVLIGIDPVFVFGIAGTADSLAGRAQVDPAAVADDTYTLLGLQLLPVQ